MLPSQTNEIILQTKSIRVISFGIRHFFFFKFELSHAQNAHSPTPPTYINPSLLQYFMTFIRKTIVMILLEDLQISPKKKIIKTLEIPETLLILF
jgi:hypothetical protein